MSFTIPSVCAKFMMLHRLQIMRSLATVLTIGIFVFDLLTPAAAAVGILYLLPMMIYLWNPNRRLTIVVASSATILTVIGALGSPAGDRELAILNRVLTVFVLWFAAALYLKRVATQASLERSNVRLGGILESAMDAIITIDADQRVLLFNPAAEAMFHCPAEKAIGRAIGEFLPQRFRDAHQEHVREFGRTRVTSRRMGTLGTVIGLRSDGAEFPVEASISHVDAAGSKLYTVILRDVTERKRSEEQLRLAIEAAPSGMILVDQQGQIILVNAQIEHQFGYSRHELLGQLVELLVPESFRAAHRGDRQHFFSAPSTRQMGKGRELFGRRKDGSEFPIEIGLNPVDTSEGIHVLASVIDITERKRLEQQLRRTERIAELGTLASGMAHEIGTPMNVILGRAEYLLGRVKEEPIQKGLQIIITQVERITKVMNQLLAFARRKTPERMPLALREVVEHSLEMFEQRLEQARIDVMLDTDDRCPNILADPDQLSQVLINLIMNAIHAMPEGGTLRIGIASADNTVKLTVADSGHGIPADALKKVFDPFFTTKEFGKGTGLGLTVVKGILEEHGGSIAVESQEGKGTTFTILLPTVPTPGGSANGQSHSTPAVL